jgi:hypothetical protein
MLKKSLHLVIVLSVFSILTVIACSAAKKTGIEGKVVDGKGLPMSGVKITATQVQPIKGYEQIESASKSDGTFKFTGVFPSSEYIIKPQSDAWQTDAETTVMTGPEGQTRLIDKPIIVRFTLQKSGVLTDSKMGLQWAPSNRQGMDHYAAEAYVKNLNLAGGGWRLPTIAEMREIYSVHTAINVTPDKHAWSSEVVNGGEDANIFYFHSGGNATFQSRRHMDNYNYTQVLAVRSNK